MLLALFTVLALAGYEFQPRLSITTAPSDGPREVFVLHPGGCLLGPLEFKEPDGTVKFKLDAGVDYPVGCSKR